MNYCGLWEKRDGRTICRAFAAWTSISDDEVAGVIAGYSGGGSFIQENFYCQFSGDTPSRLIIDYTDHISGEEDSFDDLDEEAIEAADNALDILLEFHDQDAWEDAEQLLLNTEAVGDLVDSGDGLLRTTSRYPAYLEKLFEFAGLTAKP